MGIQKLLWEVAKKSFTGGIIGLTISDRCCSVVPVRGDSMSPTMNPLKNSYLDDYVLVDKFCLKDYKFARVQGRVTRVVWPPQRVSKIGR
ncbi:hypothetical protein CARUB_v10015579mg [Capsella rubella]|uniref:Peptidase S26 domain-containing protein n=1 Tax=Capsella rubella TaxID=81985 RepID=R0G9I0_9BRAS|nr:hypothetical protein CARUB_v10015579mg [Capsella rubella]